ncbi:kinase-like domain-containing protein, partial [Lenzites betulinus]
HVQRPLGHGSFGTVVVRSRSRCYTRFADYIVIPRRERRIYDLLVAGCSPRISLFAEVLSDGADRDIYLVLAWNTFEVTTVQTMDGSGRFKAKLRVTQNILKSTALCIIDLGSAMTSSEAAAAPVVVCAKSYRPPEVDLRMALTRAVDAFAVGCIIAEVYLTQNLFDPAFSSTSEHLALVDRIAGPFPPGFARVINRDRPGTFRLQPKVEAVFPPPSAKWPRGQIVASARRVQQAKPICTRVHDVLLADLLKKLLMPDPSLRVSLAAASRHQYFDNLSAGP